MIGVYAIIHTLSGRRYIGSSIHVELRWAEHRRMLERGRHQSPRLQRAWRRDGSDAFQFVVVEEVANATQLIAREQVYLDSESKLYNVCTVAALPPSHAGVRASAETRAKISAAHKGRQKSALECEHIRLSRIGYRFSAEARARMRASHLGKSNGKHSAETIAKMSASNRGLKRSPEVCLKIRAIRARQIITPEHRAAISAGLKEAYASGRRGALKLAS